MKTTRFDSADKLTWESIIDDDTQQAMNDMNEIAIVVGETIKFSKRQHAGDVHGDDQLVLLIYPDVGRGLNISGSFQPSYIDI